MIADLAAQSQQEALYESGGWGDRRITTPRPIKRVPPRFLVILLDEGPLSLEVLTGIGQANLSADYSMPSAATDRSDGLSLNMLFLGVFTTKDDAERAMSNYLKKNPHQRFGVYDLLGTYKTQLAMEDGRQPGIRGT